MVDMLGKFKLMSASISTDWVAHWLYDFRSPGRWFAVQMIKIILAYLTLHYEIESTGPRPKTKVIGDAALPPMSASIRIRRRK